MLVSINRILLKLCLDLTIKHIRQMDAQKLCVLKYKLHVFNCTSRKWDSPNIRKQKVDENA